MVGTLVVFVLGVANFALHRAVLDSRHPLLEQMRWMRATFLLPVSLWLEFAVLLGALALDRHGWSGAVIGYAIYTGFNLASAWLILSGRA